MKNYIVLSTGEIKQAEIVSTTDTCCMVQYYKEDGIHRCVRENKEIFTSKAKAQKSIKN